MKLSMLHLLNKKYIKNARRAFENKYSKEAALESYLRVIETLLWLV